MPKIAPELTDVQVRRLQPKVVDGRHVKAMYAVGGVQGLLLQCSPPSGDGIGARSWILRTLAGGKRRDIGLGGYPDVTLADARKRAREAKDQIRMGLDPVMHRKSLIANMAAKSEKLITFQQLAEEYLAKKGKEFKSASQGLKLSNQLTRYAFPYIGKLIVADIERAHVVKMLEPIWETKTETATRVRLHVERILDLAGVKGLRSGDNPARWTGNLALSFPARSKVAETVSYGALPVEEMPEFLRELRSREGVAARALEFIIYTVTRSGETRGARWDEIDLSARLWTIPAKRMKAGKEHSVPLSISAVNLLQSLPRLSEFVFPSPQTLRPLSDVAVSKITRAMHTNATPHGFRSTFKDWCRKYTGFPDEVSELQLAHVNDDRTRAAYARDGLIEKRRLMLSDWAEFCDDGGPKRGTVVVMTR